MSGPRDPIPVPSPFWQAAGVASSYDERLRVPVTWWLLAVVLAVAVWWALVLAAPFVVALGAALGTFAVAALGLWHWGSARIQVGDGRLRAGRAVIPLDLCRAATALDADGARSLGGPDADARAYLLLRPYVRTAVRVDLADPRDPTPYWLISSRRPDELAGAVQAGSLRPSQ